MEDATDSTVESITIMAASQLIKTTVLENVIGYFIDADPAPILVVQPTTEFAESFSKERLTPMIRDTPSLKTKVKESRSRDSGNTILMKSFPGGNIALVGANAPTGLAGRPRRVVLLDEIDRYPPSAGTEGDPCALAERRTETYWNAVIYRTSSPTIKGFSRIEAAFLQTDQCRWFCPCQSCGTFQVLKWAQVLWGKERLVSAQSHGIEVLETETSDDGSDAVYACEQCGHQHDDAGRRKMVMAGEWRATMPFKGKRGYHLNGIASPFRAKKGFKTRLHQMVSGFLEAKRGGNETFKTWVNTFLAESWEEEGEKVEWGGLLERGEPYTPTTLPDGIIVVTAATDVQRDRIEVETVGLGLDDESWGIEKRVIHGNTEQADVWESFGEFLSSRYQRTDGVELSIACVSVDMRHKTRNVVEFAQRGGHARVFPVYGVSGQSPILVTSRFNKQYRLRTYAVNTKIAKDIIFARLKINETGGRYLHFPRGYGYDEEHFRQLTGEALKTKYHRGFPAQFYEKTRERNEALDLRVYWLAGLDILKPALNAISKKLRPLRPAATEVEETPKSYLLKPVATPARPRPALARPRMGRGSFVNGWTK